MTLLVLAIGGAALTLTIFRVLGKVVPAARHRSGLERLDARLIELGHRSTIWLDRVPVELRAPVQAARDGALRDVLGPVDGVLPAILVRLEVTGDARIEHAELVVKLAPGAAALTDAGVDRLAADIVTLVEAIDRRAGAELVPLGSPASIVGKDDIRIHGKTPFVRVRNFDDHDAEGAPSGAPVAVPGEE